jgi:hypothetical protein
VWEGWLVTISCGCGRECFSEWATQPVSHPRQQLGEITVEHAPRVEAPNALVESSAS